jgi:hypothetical protein
MNFEARLKQWAARHEASPAKLADLAAQVVVEAARHRHADTSAPALASMPFLGRLGYALTGAVVAGVVFVLCARQGEPQASRSESAAAMAKPTADQVTTVSRLFAETARLFPKRLRWIAQSNGDMGLGVEAADQDWPCDTPPMLVRLVVVAKTGTETAWRQVWATDVVLRGEDLAEITPNRDSANKVTLWVYPLQDGKLAVDTGVNLDEPLKIASRLSSVVKNGEPAEVATVRLGDTEYRLFQTVQPLHGAKGRTI